MRTASVVVAAFVDVVAGVAVSGQLGAEHPITVALVATAGVDASALARAVTVASRAFVLICQQSIRFECN